MLSGLRFIIILALFLILPFQAMAEDGPEANIEQLRAEVSDAEDALKTLTESLDKVIDTEQREKISAQINAKELDLLKKRLKLAELRKQLSETQKEKKRETHKKAELAKINAAKKKVELINKLVEGKEAELALADIQIEELQNHGKDTQETEARKLNLEKGLLELKRQLVDAENELINVNSGLVEEEKEMRITSIKPEEPSAGTEIVIEGSGFGSKPGTASVDNGGPTFFDRKEWTDEKLRLIAPSINNNYKPLKLNIKTADESKEAEAFVTVLPYRTDRPFQIDFLSGVEYALKSENGNNFSGGTAHVTLRATIRPVHDASLEGIARVWNAFWTFADVRLTTITITGEGEESKVEKSYASDLGAALILHKTKNDIETSLLGKIGGQTSETGPDFIMKTFLGLRFLNAGGRFNGAYFDVGYGRSENFEGKDHRYKISMFLPLEVLGLDTFLSSDIETDFSGEKSDSVAFVVGARIKPEHILDFIKK